MTDNLQYISTLIYINGNRHGYRRFYDENGWRQYCLYEKEIHQTPK